MLLNADHLKQQSKQSFGYTKLTPTQDDKFTEGNSTFYLSQLDYKYQSDTPAAHNPQPNLTIIQRLLCYSPGLTTTFTICSFLLCFATFYGIITISSLLIEGQSSPYDQYSKPLLAILVFIALVLSLVILSYYWFKKQCTLYRYKNYESQPRRNHKLFLVIGGAVITLSLILAALLYAAGRFWLSQNYATSGLYLDLLFMAGLFNLVALGSYWICRRQVPKELTTTQYKSYKTKLHVIFTLLVFLSLGVTILIAANYITQYQRTNVPITDYETIGYLYHLFFYVLGSIKTTP
ncbi:hypothetical protein NEHOM01_0810 [Nematocida homosporus]|uniref:uncharacterized protein n=1 Tax=Nematocida homosporus TaxID=1912981 RepID=UPI00221E7E07|nr:uncharacterized protein NEHOM01_0810 [Nematocida homosporus]KAI5185395.1 hypothetical protein NEHOM01_0810 [Nematocida homosporus]